MDEAPPGSPLDTADGQPSAPIHRQPDPLSEEGQQSKGQPLITEGARDGLSEDHPTEKSVFTLPATQEPTSPQVSHQQQEAERDRRLQADKDRLLMRFDPDKRPPLAVHSWIEGFVPRRRSGSADAASTSQEPISPQVFQQSQQQQKTERGRKRQAEKDRLAEGIETIKHPPRAGSNENRTRHIESYRPSRQSGSAAALSASQEAISPQVSQRRQQQEESERGRKRQAEKDRLAERFETTKRPPLADSYENRTSYIEGYRSQRRPGSAAAQSPRTVNDDVVHIGRYHQATFTPRAAFASSQVPRSMARDSGHRSGGSSAAYDDHEEENREPSNLNIDDLDRQMLRHLKSRYSAQELADSMMRQHDNKDPDVDHVSPYSARGGRNEKARLSAEMTHAPDHQQSWSELPRELPSTAAGAVRQERDDILLPQLWSSWEEYIQSHTNPFQEVVGWTEVIRCLEHSKPTHLQWEQYCRIIEQPTSTDDVVHQVHGFKSLVSLEIEETPSVAICLRLITSWLSQVYHSARHARKEGRSKRTPLNLKSFEEIHLVQIFDIAEDLFQRDSVRLEALGTEGLLTQLCHIARTTFVESDLEACIRLIKTITERSRLPHEKLVKCVEILATVFCFVPQTRERAWVGLLQLFKKDKNGDIFRSMIDSTFLEYEWEDKYQPHSKILLGVIEKLLSEDTTKTYPAMTLDLLIKGISGMVEGSSSIKTYNYATQIIHSLFDFSDKGIHPLVQNKDWSACLNIVIRCYQKLYVDHVDVFHREPEAASELKHSTLLLIGTLIAMKDTAGVEPSKIASIDKFLVDVSNFQTPKRRDSASDQQHTNTANDPMNAEVSSSEEDIKVLNAHLEQNVQDNPVTSDAAGMPSTPHTDEGLAQDAEADYFDGASIDDAMSVSIDGSDIESLFSTGSLPSSQSSQGGVFHLVVLEWAKLLRHDTGLQLLYPTAILKVGPERFQRNFARFLKVYGKKLKEEASNDLHHEVASFVRQSARRTALEIRRMLSPDSDGFFTPLSLTGTEVSRKIQVSRWLESHSARPDGPLPETTKPDPNNDLFDMSDSEQSETFDRTSFRTLAETESFMVSSAAFSGLQQDFRAWLEIDKESNPKRAKEPQNITDAPQDERNSYDGLDKRPFIPCQPRSRKGMQVNGPPVTMHETLGGLQKENEDFQVPQTDGDKNCEAEEDLTPHVWSRLRFRIACMLAPPLPGYQRVSYICGCGQFSYVDLKELSTGGIEKFRRRLIKSAAAVRRRPQHALGSTVLQHPPPAYLSRNGSAHGLRAERRTNPLKPGGSPGDTEDDNDGDRDTSTQAGQSDLAHDLQYLLLCVYTRTSTTLVHLEVSRFSNDQYLFEELRRAYQKAREENEWRLHLLVPVWLQTIVQAVLQKLPAIPGCKRAFAGLGRAVQQMSLYRIASGDFVRFQLVPIGERSCPTWFKAREFPPPSEVIAKRYLYEPVPMDDVEFADIPLAHLLQPGPHLDTFWKSVFPKKLCEELRRPAMSGGRVIGWGVRINESLNWSVVLLGIFLQLLLIGVIVVVYSAVTSDNSSAFGLGAFLMAIFTVYITYQYFAWREKT